MARMAKSLPPFVAPGGVRTLLLHSCCAPCAGPIMEKLRREDFDFTVLFYNPNIQPADEYELRKQENIRYAAELGVPFVDLDYEPQTWFARVRGLEWEPERGARCTVCFEMRFERSALYAVENGFSVFTSTLGISRWKDMDQINAAGERVAARYPGLTYWTWNWRKGGGTQRMSEIAKEKQFYQQEYCGCVYSLRDTNRHRLAQGRGRIVRGVKFYGRNDPEETPR